MLDLVLVEGLSMQCEIRTALVSLGHLLLCGGVAEILPRPVPVLAKGTRPTRQ